MHDALPSYSPSVHHVGVVMIRNEQVTPYQVASSQTWTPLIMELNSTQLNLYRLADPKLERCAASHFKTSTSCSPAERTLDNKYVSSSKESSFASSKLRYFHRKSTSSELDSIYQDRIHGALHTFPNLTTTNILQLDPQLDRELSSPALRGPLFATYTLQHAQIGSAVDNHSMHFVLRIRLELEQFSFQVANFKEFLIWYQKIQIGAEISLPVDSRIGDDDIFSMKTPGSQTDSGSPSSKSHAPETADQQMAQLLYISQSIKPLQRKDKWVGKQVVVYDCLPKVEGYVYNLESSHLFPRKTLRRKEIGVSLVRRQQVIDYIRAKKRGKIEIQGAEEYLISFGGLVTPLATR